MKTFAAFGTFSSEEVDLLGSFGGNGRPRFAGAIALRAVVWLTGSFASVACGHPALSEGGYRRFWRLCTFSFARAIVLSRWRCMRASAVLHCFVVSDFEASLTARVRMSCLCLLLRDANGPQEVCKLRRPVRFCFETRLWSTVRLWPFTGFRTVPRRPTGFRVAQSLIRERALSQCFAVTDRAASLTARPRMSFR